MMCCNYAVKWLQFLRGWFVPGWHVSWSVCFMLMWYFKLEVLQWKENAFLRRVCNILYVSWLFYLRDFFFIRWKGQDAVLELYRLLLLTVASGSTACLRMRGGRRRVNCLNCITCWWEYTTVTKLAPKTEAESLFSPLAVKAEQRGSAIHPTAMFSFLFTLKCNIESLLFKWTAVLDVGVVWECSPTE